MTSRMLTRSFPRHYKPFFLLNRINLQTRSHHDLSSFLTHAQNASLDPNSNTFVGTYYEYLCASTLSRLSFTLSRVGKTGDAGIDLVGDWQLPALPFPLRVLVQCKAHKSQAAPATIRELPGATAGAPEGWRGDQTVGVLCTKSPATKGAIEAVRKSGMPVVYIMIEDAGEGKGLVRQILWNERVNKIGAEGMAVGLRYVVEEGKKVDKEAVLLWKGRVWKSRQKRGARSTTIPKGVNTETGKATGRSDNTSDDGKS